MTTNSKSKPTELARLATLDRRNGVEQIRWSWDRFTGADGQTTDYISVRKWYWGSDDAWHPTRSGVTIRANELSEVLGALQRAHTDLMKG
ncbi:MAG TPA: hypothetical protein VFU02_17690 [Polyangiaceae bacterium]|nr:hypothetical protein [Polyangiaceae bacterium]